MYHILKKTFIINGDSHRGMAHSGDHTDRSEEELTDGELASRRWMLKMGLTSAVGMSGLAGCMGQDGDGETTTTTTTTTEGDGGDDGDGGDGDTGDGGDGGDGGTLADDELTLPATRYSPQFQWNTFNGKNSVPRYIFNIIYPRLAFYTREETWEPVIAADWSMPDALEKDAEVSVTIRDDITWDNGDQLTAQDYVKGYRLQKLVSEPMPEVASFSVVDDTTFKLTMNEAISPGVFTGRLLYLNADNRAGSPNFKEFHERQADATSQQERDAIVSELVQQYTIDKPIGFGPWQHAEVSPQFMLFEARDDYPIGDLMSEDDLNVPSVKYLNVTDTLQLAVSNDRVDQAAQQRFYYNPQNRPEHAEVRTFSEISGFSLAFDHRKPLLGNRRVRKAIAHVLDTYQINLDMAPEAVSAERRQEFASFTAFDTQTYLSNRQAEVYLGDSLDSMQDYLTEQKPIPAERRQQSRERAAQILRDEGFTKEGKWWRTPEGKKWQLEIRNYGEWDWMSVARSCMGQLRNFGIDVQQRVVESTQFWSNAGNKEDSFDLKLGVWGAGGVKRPAHPWHNYSGMRGTSVFNRVLFKQHPDASGWGGLKPDTPITVDVPMPVGDPQGDVEEINITPLIKELGQTSDEQRINELTTQLAWIHNQYLMHIPVIKFLRSVLVTNDHWNWEPKDDPLDTMRGHIDRTGYPIGIVKGKFQ
jgi:peptide/nickel transport system substrate-binding protein